MLQFLQYSHPYSSKGLSGSSSSSVAPLSAPETYLQVVTQVSCISGRHPGNDNPRQLRSPKAERMYVFPHVTCEGEETVSFSAQTAKHEGKQENTAEHILFCPQVTPRTRQSPVTELFTQKLTVVAVPLLPGHAKQRGASAERERDQKAQIDTRWFGFRGLCKKGSKATATSTSKESGRVTYFVAMHYYIIIM